MGLHGDVAFRVPAGPPVPPAYREYVFYDATNLQVSFTPPPNPQMQELLVHLTSFVADDKTYQVKTPAGDESPIPLKIKGPLP